MDICYPQSNIELYMMIKQTGSIISEYPPRTKPNHGFFPERNRIISGLSDIVIIVEAGEKILLKTESHSCWRLPLRWSYVPIAVPFPPAESACSYPP